MRARNLARFHKAGWAEKVGELCPFGFSVYLGLPAPLGLNFSLLF